MELMPEEWAKFAEEQKEELRLEVIWDMKEVVEGLWIAVEVAKYHQEKAEQEREVAIRKIPKK